MEAASLPDNSKGGWVAFGIDQTKNLDAANGRGQGALTIVGQCDKLNAH